MARLLPKIEPKKPMPYGYGLPVIAPPVMGEEAMSIPANAVPTASAVSPTAYGQNVEGKPTEKASSTKGKVISGALGALSSLFPMPGQEQQTGGEMLPTLEMQPIGQAPMLYRNPYNRQAKFGGKFYPGDKVLVGEGSGPEIVHVKKDGIEVESNPADKLPAITPPVAEEPVDVSRPLPAIEPTTAYGANVQGLPEIGLAQVQPTADAEVDAPTPGGTRQYLSDGNGIANGATPTLPSIGDMPADPYADRIAQETEAATAPLHRTDPHKHSLWSRVAAAALGWAKGGLLGGIEAARNPHYWEDAKGRERQADAVQNLGILEHAQQTQSLANQRRMQPVMKQQELQARYARDRQSFEDRMRLAQEKAAAEGNKWELKTNPATGELMKVYKNRGANDPNGPQTEVYLDTNGNRVVDPNAQVYDWTDPFSGQTVRIKGAALATAGATIASGNAQRTQDASKFNASQALEAEKTNVANRYNYAKTLFDRAAEMAKANGEAQGAFAQAQGLYTQMEQAANALQSTDPAADPKGYEAARKNFDDLQEKFYQAVGKTQSGATAVQQMNSQGLQRPETVRFNPITPATVQVPRQSVSESVFRERLRANGITDPARQKALIQQARTDGVIK